MGDSSDGSISPSAENRCLVCVAEKSASKEIFVVIFVCLFETGFLCIALAFLELAL